MPKAQDRKDLRRRNKSLRQTKQALVVALSNADGLKRLVGLTDEEWTEAQKLDDQTAAESEGENEKG